MAKFVFLCCFAFLAVSLLGPCDVLLDRLAHLKQKYVMLKKYANESSPENQKSQKESKLLDTLNFQVQ